jgi:hypothetical protein
MILPPKFSIQIAPELPADLFQLTELFHVGFSFITADNISAPNWQTNRKYRLTTGEFIKRYSDELSLLGVSFGDRTNYVMLDVDIDSPNHPANDPNRYAKLLRSLEKSGLLYPVSIRSSTSGGIHLYYFFARSVKTFRIAALIRVTLINAGFSIKNGHLEIFPNTKPFSPDKAKPTFYKAHRLPLQPNSGACLLDRWGDELLCSVNLTHERQLEYFLAEAEKSAQINDIDLIESKLDWAYSLFKTKIAKYQHHCGNYSEVAQEWKENLELTIDISWTGYHQTNSLIPIYICYGIVFKGLEDKQELFEWAHEKITTARGYQEYCRHQHDIERKIRDWIDCSIDNQYYVKYCGFPARSGITPHQLISKLNRRKSVSIDLNFHNQTLADRTRRRLAEILAAIQELPRKIGDRIAAIQTKCIELFGETISRTTLYKTDYKPLWLEKNNTPPLFVMETSPHAEIELESTELQSQLEIPTIQVQSNLSHTPCLYEAYVPNPDEPSDFAVEEYCSSLTSVETLLNIHTQLTNSTFSLSDSDLSLSLSQPEPTEDSVRVELNSLHTTDELCILPILEHTRSKSVRSVIEIARDVRLMLGSEIDDELLLELIHHPQQVEIQTMLDLAERLVAAATRDLVLNLVGDLDRDRKSDLWRVLRVEERSAVTAVMAQPVSVEADESIAVVVEISSVLVEVAAQVVESVETIPDIVVGTMLRRNAQKIRGKEYPALVGCEAISGNGVNWTVRSVCGGLFNVSQYSIESGLWSIEPGAVVTSAIAIVEPSAPASPVMFAIPVDREAVDLTSSTPIAGEVSPVMPMPTHGFTLGLTVSTLTGLVGTVKHVFQSTAKPILVFHASIGRTICYRVEDLQVPLDRVGGLE